MKYRILLIIFIAAMVIGCMLPNTYYDPVDPYARGRRYYDRGRYDLAAQYWEPLLEKGDCDAEYWVGMLYFLGQGKKNDTQKALEFWRKAANGNHPKAQAAMGDIYYQNEAIIYHHCKDCNVQKDVIQAYVWYKLLEKSARYKGEKEHAADVLQEIRKEMSREQLSEAEVAFSQWRPTPKDCSPRHWW